MLVVVVVDELVVVVEVGGLVDVVEVDGLVVVVEVDGLVVVVEVGGLVDAVEVDGLVVVVEVDGLVVVVEVDGLVVVVEVDGLVDVVDVDEVVVEVDGLVVVVDVDELLVVVVVDTSGAHVIRTFRPADSSRAQAAPLNVEASPKTSRALGAVMKARTVACAPTWTESPVTFNTGVGVLPIGSKVEASLILTSSRTLMVDWATPVTLIFTCLPVRSWQTV
jgi:hypothetical protein